MDKSLIVISIDFGTTYSGVAHTYLPTTSRGSSCKSEEVLVLTEWPGRSSDKVPTRFAFSPSEEPASKRVRFEEKRSLSNPPVFKYGFDVGIYDTVIECVKLLLPKDRVIPGHISRDDVETELSKHNKSVESATVQYLQALLHRVDVDLERRYQSSRVTGTDRRYVLTVPALWTDAEKNLTRELAVRAGFPKDIWLVSEPEAAAVCALLTASNLQLKVGNVYVVCDAGGGTVDLISYEITRLNPLRLKEVVAGTGGLCGGSYINERFEQHVRDKIGVEEFEAFKKENPEAWHDAMTTFEDKIKRSFDPSEINSRTYRIACIGIPSNYKAGIKNSWITLSTNELINIFEPLVTEVTHLITLQVDAVREHYDKPNGILLVGGLGQCNWLLDRIKVHFMSQSVEATRPPSSWTAVARGAVLWAAESASMVDSRKARVWYGTDVSPRFVPGRHPPESRTWDHLDEIWRSSDRFEVFLKRDQTVSLRDAFTIRFQTNFLPRENRTTYTWLYTSASIARPEDTVTHPVTRLCQLVSNLSRVPSRYFKRKVNSRGTVFYALDFELKVRLESGGLKFWLEVDGVEYSTVTASFV